ncbi:hypothetical protein RSSM_04093 [Rhodopirellula sallentina SM41]|uniref:Uncharacterized protein n=1 Tax=Rhodopirellula sallentina SM41 TaxID=1263870 RepID=M5UES0_9BACT|nr:hypothetical protein RSSM_04093 [Rhodopirellula sallentina SM41]
MKISRSKSGDFGYVLENRGQCRSADKFLDWFVEAQRRLANHEAFRPSP